MIRRVPDHLKKFCVTQDYDRYTPEDQAVWRYIMRQLRDYLRRHAHPCYEEGLEQTGITVEEIPQIIQMNERLQKFGWGAVPVSGFIPPSAFMEFQANRVLPIACEMRSIEHILYTPAPDIVHEAAGHAPILIDKDFSQYLAKYADVAANAIISSEDLKLYEAIRNLSDIKESPDSTPEQISKCEMDLQTAIKGISFVSEGALLGRMNWWTAEYGLIGSLEEPKIFGAGLLSSVGEAREYLSAKVKKIPLTLKCVDYSYDITEKQPQLFVATDFAALGDVLDELADSLSFRRGGMSGLQRAQQAKTVNTVELDSGVQISGKLESFEFDKQIDFVKFDGPCQISHLRSQLEGQGVSRHAKGFSAPLGDFSASPPLSTVKKDERIQLVFVSGFEIDGKYVASIASDGKTLGATLNDVTIKRGSRVYYRPEWGEFDLVFGKRVTSVFGGPADRKSYGFEDEFIAARVARRKPSVGLQERFTRYEKLRRWRRELRSLKDEEITAFAQVLESSGSQDWLVNLELLEIVTAKNHSAKGEIAQRLKRWSEHDPTLRMRIEDGMALASQLN